MQSDLAKEKQISTVTDKSRPFKGKLKADFQALPQVEGVRQDMEATMAKIAVHRDTIASSADALKIILALSEALMEGADKDEAARSAKSLGFGKIKSCPFGKAA